MFYLFRKVHALYAFKNVFKHLILKWNSVRKNILEKQ